MAPLGIIVPVLDNWSLGSIGLRQGIFALFTIYGVHGLLFACFVFRACAQS